MFSDLQRGLFLLAVALGVPFAGLADVVIHEIHHTPDVKQEPVEFVELYNTGPGPVDLGGWRFDDGVAYEFPAGTRMEPGAFLVVAGNPEAVTAKFGVTGVLGPWTGRLAGSGERLRLRQASGEVASVVVYGMGFPWPTVGEPPGYSIELIHPGLDNTVGGHWRASVVGASDANAIPLRAARERWRIWKGTREPSNPPTAWRDPDFDDAAWEEGSGPVGYDPEVAMGTRLADMRGGYVQFFLRGEFDLSEAESLGGLRLGALFDDGFKLWINGHLAFYQGLPPGEVSRQSPATGEAREDNAYQRFESFLPPGVLRDGRNVIAVQVANVNLGSSSDAFFDARLSGLRGPVSRGPTPGRTNSVHAPNAPPAVREVTHQPRSPRSGDPVTVEAWVTDPDGVDAVFLEYQVVRPGDYIEREDPRFESEWVRVAMEPVDGAKDRYVARLPEEAVQHRTLVRYRLITADATGLVGAAPLEDDPQPNFALYCDDGIPAWSGAVRPGAPGDLGAEFIVDATEMKRMPVYRLVARRQAVEDSTWYDRSHGDEYFWTGTLVADGRVYDHIRFRPRGGVWRYAMGKNMWKFDFNRGHDFEARDNWGRPFRTRWRKLNLGASIQQGNFNHRGEHGLFESVGFRLFQLAGVPASQTTFVQFRIVDDAQEVAPGDPYSGDFWGVYLAVEQLGGRFLDENGLPDGNFYKMEGGFGDPNNLSPDGPVDSSDLSAFLNAYSPGSNASLSDDWWRANLNLEAYYSYQVIVQAIHHYDIADGKNYFYYRNPVDRRWTVIPWDLDLTWADSMYRAGRTGGDEPFKSRVLSNFSPNPARPALAREFRNRVREVRDLLWNFDEAYRLIDEYARLLRGSAPHSLIDADRAQWDFNPIMVNPAIVNLDKAGHGRFYRFPGGPGVTRDFAGAVQLMKNYVGSRATNATFSLDTLAAEPEIPDRPGLAYLGPEGFPVDRLTFSVGSYEGSAPLQSVKWRVGEISRMGHPGWDPAGPMAYEIQAVWETPELLPTSTAIEVPARALRVGGLYRIRARFTDTEGRTSHWSEPVEFTAGEAADVGLLPRDLRLTEIMYHPLPDGFEFLELHNPLSSAALILDGATFSRGIAYTFPPGSLLPPGGYALLAGTPDFGAFRQWAGLSPEHLVFGPYTGALDNAGETVELLTAPGGERVFRVTYGDRDPWPTEADGDGYSLVPRLGGSAILDDPAYWRISTDVGGSPGRADPERLLSVEGYARTPEGLAVRFLAGDGVRWIAESGTLDSAWIPVATNTGPATVLLPLTGAGGLRFVRGRLARE